MESQYLERQVAQKNRPLYPKVAHNMSKVAHNYRPLAFQVAHNLGLLCLSNGYGACVGPVGVY